MGRKPTGRPRGRPTLAPAAKRAPVTVSLSAEERARIDAAADAEGRTVSAYLRLAGLERAQRPPRVRGRTPRDEE